MGRPTKPISEAKKPVTISLHPRDILILDTLARELKFTRSKVVQDLIIAKGEKQLNVVDNEQHLGNGKGWPRHQNQVNHANKGRKYIPKFDPDGISGCNPYLASGQCKHSHCQLVYRKYGVI